ncbi:Organic solute transporter subunit alpha [Holothuria leucospilota]|uniref:Organic solute transporter subunit alpha n=1 Tax=Holothuria leucospilota TaxID=206669 RepID=A0A9Q1HH30_HOLLE|nr:Organic solute transporter subunit alpha [Holothuria leucospilota]
MIVLNFTEAEVVPVSGESLVTASLVEVSANIIKMAPNCSENSLSMAELFRATSGDIGFMFFIIFMTLLTFATAIIFFESAFYLDRKIPASRRKVRLLIVLGIFPFISTCALLALYMPKSHLITTFTSTIYFSLAIYQFLGLIFDYYGGKVALLELLKDKTIPLAGPPLTCCCYCCIPPLRMTPRNLRIVKWLVLQVTIVRPVVLFIGLVTWADGSYVPGNLTFKSINLYVQLISLGSTLVALWGVIMFVRVSRGPLAKYRVTPKFLIVQICLITVSGQAILIAIIGGVGWIPCTNVFRSLDRGNYINDMLLVIEMFLFMVVSRVFFRSRKGNMGTLLDDDIEAPENEPSGGKQKSKELEAIGHNGNSNYNNNGSTNENSGNDNKGYADSVNVDIAVVKTGESQDIIALSNGDVAMSYEDNDGIVLTNYENRF